MAWTDEEKEQVVADYLAQEPTAETSMEIVTSIAKDIAKTPNGVRMILTKAEVYVKKAAAAETKAAAGTKSTRVSKAGAQEALSAAITDAGLSVDEEIISKLTGKAAQYFTTLLSVPSEAPADDGSIPFED